MLGDSSVGKTCLLLRFVDDQFPKNHLPTIGIDFKIKTIKLDNKVIKLQVWDTAGQERYRTITQTYYKGAMGIILVYDCSDPKSFKSIQSWMKQIDEHANPGVAKILVANKCDLEPKQVNPSEGKALADNYGLPFIETSAKSGMNVELLFESLARQILHGGTGGRSAPHGINIADPDDETGGKKKSCCKS